MIGVSEGSLSIQDVIENTHRPEMGAIVTFLGTVRSHTNNQKVLKLEFEAEKELAVKELKKIRTEAIERFGVTDVSIVHRIGNLDVGENIVIIAVGAGHRDEAFKACRFAIDELKKTVPIWKKEFVEGDSYWVSERE